jgi:hypothetical protein
MGDHVAESSTPTQAAHPWRATVRTVLAAVVGLALLAPTVAHELGVESIPWVAGALALIAAVTRVLALPGVIAWTERFLPWLAPSKTD